MAIWLSYGSINIHVYLIWRHELVSPMTMDTCAPVFKLYITDEFCRLGFGDVKKSGGVLCSPSCGIVIVLPHLSIIAKRTVLPNPDTVYFPSRTDSEARNKGNVSCSQWKLSKA